MKMKMRLVCWCLDILCILLSNAASSPFSRWYQSIQAIMIRVYLLLCRQAYLVTSYWCMQCNMPAAHLMYHSAVPMSYTRNNYRFSIQRLWCGGPHIWGVTVTLFDKEITSSHHNITSQAHMSAPDTAGRGSFAIKILISTQKWFYPSCNVHMTKLSSFEVTSWWSRG